MMPGWSPPFFFEILNTKYCRKRPLQAQPNFLFFFMANGVSYSKTCLGVVSPVSGTRCYLFGTHFRQLNAYFFWFCKGSDIRIFGDFFELPPKTICYACNIGTSPKLAVSQFLPPFQGSVWQTPSHFLVTLELIFRNGDFQLHGISGNSQEKNRADLSSLGIKYHTMAGGVRPIRIPDH
jgi:hypothetical protein